MGNEAIEVVIKPYCLLSGGATTLTAVVETCCRFVVFLGFDSVMIAPFANERDFLIDDWQL